MKFVTNKFKSGGLHEKHVAVTWNLGNHLSICLQAQVNEEKPVSRWPVAGPSEYWLLASSPASKNLTVLKISSLNTVLQKRALRLLKKRCVIQRGIRWWQQIRVPQDTLHEVSIYEWIIKTQTSFYIVKANKRPLRILDVLFEVFPSEADWILNILKVTTR